MRRLYFYVVNRALIIIALVAATIALATCSVLLYINYKKNNTSGSVLLLIMTGISLSLIVVNIWRFRKFNN